MGYEAIQHREQQISASCARSVASASATDEDRAALATAELVAGGIQLTLGDPPKAVADW